MWVKICGITNLEDARTAVQAGADALGFIFVATSPRVITRRRAEEILSDLPETVQTVGVVADEDPDFIKGLLRVCPFKAIQFHGGEPPEEVLSFKREIKLIKAIRIQDAQSLEQIPLYAGVDSILLDTLDPKRRGGTGTAFDWKLALKAKEFGIPVILAGGLRPENVAQAIRQVEPYGVDVVSGVEAAAGRKDHDRVRQFVLAAKAAL